MAPSARVAVVGAGIVGLATAYALRERGVPVRLYESGVPGHAQSGGDARVFRHGHVDPRLVPLAAESRSIYEAWSAALGEELVSRDGAVAIGPAAVARLAVLERVGGVRARALDPEELAARMPLLAPFAGPAMLDEDGGAIRAREAVEALTARLRDVLVADEVLSVRPTGGERVEVRSGGSVERFERVVVCAGRGTAALARGVGLSLPVRTSAHVRATFVVRGEAPAVLPCLQDSSGAFGEAGIYAAPVAGNRRYGVGLSAAVEAREDGALVDPAGLAELADRAAAYVSRALPGLDPRPVEFRHCWATELPWAPDGLAVWEHEGLLIVAGHNLFKLAPLLGRRLAAAADGEPLDPALRPAVRLGAPPRSAGGRVDEPAAAERTPVAGTTGTATTG